MVFVLSKFADLGGVGKSRTPVPEHILIEHPGFEHPGPTVAEESWHKFVAMIMFLNYQLGTVP